MGKYAIIISKAIKNIKTIPAYKKKLNINDLKSSILIKS